MTVMRHLLIKVHGDEDWEAWKDDWWSNVDRVAWLSDVEGWLGPPAWVHERSTERQLDWGASLYSGLTKADVQKLTRAPTNDQEQRELLANLSENERYGVVYVEIY
jgi:hypothetical protein